jgi:hypothetical protein
MHHHAPDLTEPTLAQNGPPRAMEVEGGARPPTKSITGT